MCTHLLAFRRGAVLNRALLCLRASPRRKASSCIHLAALATRPGEKCGLTSTRYALPYQVATGTLEYREAWPDRTSRPWQIMVAGTVCVDALWSVARLAPVTGGTAAAVCCSLVLLQQ